MEVPPGRLERSLSGGKDALAALLTEAAERRLNGLLATSRTREDVPARGVLVFHKGNGSLASHSGRGGDGGAPPGPPRHEGLGGLPLPLWNTRTPRAGTSSRVRDVARRPFRRRSAASVRSAARASLPPLRDRSRRPGGTSMRAVRPCYQAK